MTNETQQPFTGDQPRKTDDTKLVAKVLGTTEAAEMAELVGGQTKPVEQEQKVDELTITESEQDAATEVEQEMAPNQRRQQYIDWAYEFGGNENWIDETFIFESDGRVRVEGDLDLSGNNISELPPCLYKVEGKLYLNKNQISKIENIPSSVTELHLGDNQITKIENIPNTVTVLSLSGNQIAKIENIPNSVIHLGLSYNKITTIENIPDSVKTLYLNNNQITKKGNIPDTVTKIVLYDNPIESLMSINCTNV